MKQIIEDLEKKLSELKESYEIQQRKNCENGIHKEFEVNDVVTNGVETGIVSWVENKGVGCEKEKGYMGLSLLTQRMGFKIAKRDEYEKIETKYYTENHKIEFYLSGIEIDELIYRLSHSNGSKVSEKITKQLETKRERKNK
jgi:hypothetical protein